MSSATNSTTELTNLSPDDPAVTQLHLQHDTQHNMRQSIDTVKAKLRTQRKLNRQHRLSIEDSITDDTDTGALAKTHQNTVRLQRDSSSSTGSSSSSSSSGSSSSDSSSGSSRDDDEPPVYMPLLGKSSVQANKRLLSIFETVIEQHHKRYPFMTKDVVVQELLSYNNAACVFCSLVFAIGFAITGAYWMLAESIIVLCILTVNTLLTTWRQYLEHTEMVRLLQNRIELVRQLPSLAQTDTSQPPSSSFVRVFRDGIWRALPQNLLVENDVIELDPDDVAPCDCQMLPRHLWIQAKSTEANASSVMSAAAAAMNAASVHDKHRHLHHQHVNGHKPPQSVASTDHETDSTMSTAASPVYDATNAVNMSSNRYKLDRRGSSQQRGSDGLNSPIVRLRAGEPQPTSHDSTSQLPTQLPLPDNSMFADLQGAEPRQYLVDVSPLIGQLESVLTPPHMYQHQHPPVNGVVARYRIIVKHMRYILVTGICVYIIIAIIRLSVLSEWMSVTDWFYGPQLPTFWYRELCYRAAVIAVPSLAIAAPLYLFAVDAVTNGLFLALQESIEADTERKLEPIQRQRRNRNKRKGKYDDDDTDQQRDISISISSQDSIDSDQSYDDTDETNSFEYLDSLKIPFKSVWRHTYDILTGHERYMTRRINPVQTLANVTVFCCPDNEGILSENESSPDHILFFNNQDRPVVLDLINDPTSHNGIVIEGEWQQYISCLKPIGLNCCMTNACNLHDSMVCQYDWDSSSDTNVGCLCLLAREIGFDVGRTRQQYYVSKAIHNVALQSNEAKWRRFAQKKKRRHVDASAVFDPKIRTMTGVSMLDRFESDKVQFMTNGDPALVLHNCVEYWDGNNIRQLDDNSRQLLLSIYQQWLYQDLRCIGFAYTPVPYDTAAAFVQPDRPAAYLIECVDLDKPNTAVQQQIQLEQQAELNSPHPHHRDEQADSDHADDEKSRHSGDDSNEQSESSDRSDDSAGNETPAVDITKVNIDSPSRNGNAATHDLHDIAEHNGINHDVNGSDINGVHSVHSEDTFDEFDARLRSDAIQTILSPPSPAEPMRPTMPISSPVLFHPNISFERAHSSPALPHASIKQQHNMTISPAPFDIDTDSFSAELHHLSGNATQPNISVQPSTEGEVFKLVQKSQIFNGIVAMRDQPKTEVRSLVESLNHAGVRFVYFSPDDNRKTQAFGSKIGVFTDFNYFVSLSEVTCDDAELVHEGKSRLPRGVPAIRYHLQHIDNVPLLVSLFTECTAKTSREMIRIYQENGESVLCIGSSLKVENTDVFMQSDIAISLDPVPEQQCEYKSFNDNSISSEPYTASKEYALSSAITTLPCVLPLPYTTNLHQFNVLIAQSRQMVHNIHQFLYFVFAGNLTLFTISFTSSVIDTAPLFTAYQKIWLVYFVVPVIGLSLMATPREPDLMRRMPAKQTEHLSDLKRLIVYWAIKFSMTVVLYILFNIWLLHSSCSARGIRVQSVYYWQSGTNPLYDNTEFRNILLGVQNFSIVLLVYILIIHSHSFLYRYWSIHKLSGFRCMVWMGTCVCILALQIVFCAVSMVGADIDISEIKLISSEYISSAVLPCALVVWPLYILGVDQLCKRHDQATREIDHKFARQQFDTVLGMHSPQ